MTERIDQARALEARQDAEVKRRTKWAEVRLLVAHMNDSEVYVANRVLEALLGEPPNYQSATNESQISSEPPPFPEPPPEAPQRLPVRREPPSRSEGEQGPGALEL